MAEFTREELEPDELVLKCMVPVYIVMVTTMPNSRPLAGQLTLGAIPGVTTADRIQAARRARALPSKPQRAMDIGLFSDDAAQLDLIEMFQDPAND